jgi:hypothetical protein
MDRRKFLCTTIGTICGASLISSKSYSEQILQNHFPPLNAKDMIECVKVDGGTELIEKSRQLEIETAKRVASYRLVINDTVEITNPKDITTIQEMFEDKLYVQFEITGEEFNKLSDGSIKVYDASSSFYDDLYFNCIERYHLYYNDVLISTTKIDKMIINYKKHEILRVELNINTPDPLKNLKKSFKKVDNTDPESKVVTNCIVRKKEV